MTREVFKKNYLKTGSFINYLSPGPSVYKSYYEIGKFSTKVTLKSRTAIIDAKMKSNYPSPNKYQPPTCISERGKYFISDYRDSGAPRIGPVKPLAPLSMIINSFRKTGPWARII